MTQKIQTVNVVEYKRATDDMSVHSFNDNDEGNKEADLLLMKKMMSRYSMLYDFTSCT